MTVDDYYELMCSIEDLNILTKNKKEEEDLNSVYSLNKKKVQTC